MKKVLVSILSLIFIVSMITTVYAATGTVTLGASSDTVFKGKTFTVTVAAAGDNNVTGIKSILSYDTSKLSLDKKETANGFTDIPSGNELNAGILSTEGLTLSKSVTIYTLTFKVLDTATEGDTEIALSNVELALVNDSQEQLDVAAEGDKVTIKIKADDTTVDNKGEEENKIETPSNTTDSGNESTGSNSGNKTTTKKENTVKTPSKNTATKLPQTGIEDVSIIAIIALAAMGISSYISYRKYKNVK